ncbi:myelin expression factor 2-like isoform X2 [Lineus longissimus]|uniref:myelin expression factor 2-like isoform X2 n=1 Tax=Lineus longissimus TaxID=88925 RepID=UPI00315DDA88
MADLQDSMGGENGFENRNAGRSRSRSRSRSRDRDNRRDRRGRDREDRKPRTDNLKSKRVYICNLPYEAKWQDIKDLMKKEVGDAYVELYEDSNGKASGCGCVEFRTIELAKECIEKMYRYEYKGRGLVVREEKDKDRERHGKDSDRGMSMGGGGYGGGGGGGGYGSGGYGGRDSGFGGGGGIGSMSSMQSSGPPSLSSYAGHDHYGIPVEILMELDIVPPLVSQVFVSNLPYKISSERLKEVFSVAGNVLRADILTDEDGKSKGKGIVEFESPREAVEAIALLKDQLLVDRQMCVHMDKKAKCGEEKRLPAGLKTVGKSISLRGARYGGSCMSDFGSSSGMGGSSGMGSSGMGSSMMGSSMMSDNMNMMGNYGSSNSMLGSGMSSMGNMGGMSSMSGMNSMGSGTSSGFGSGMSNLSQFSSSMGNFGMGSGNSMLGNTDSGFGSSGMSGMSNYGMSDMSRNMGMSGMGMSSSMMNSSMDSGMSGRSSGRGEARRNGGGGGGGDSDDYTLIVRNLDYKVSWQDLKDHFRSVGEVKYAKIKMEDGKSSGQGIVRFRTLSEAEKAINQFNGSKFNGRTLRLKLDDGIKDKSSEPSEHPNRFLQNLDRDLHREKERQKDKDRLNKHKENDIATRNVFLGLS